ncbi:MAG: hypothetical protein OEM52_12000 [bacterium]|nr:hypothetical protein [bacterium]
MIFHRQHWHYPKNYHCLIDVALMLLTVFGIVLLLALTTKAQTLSGAEYYIDSDPGYGMATPIPIQVGGSFCDTAFTVNLSGISVGFHSLFTRIRDNNGVWSLPIVKPILVENIPAGFANVTAAEYFLDSDPGFGAGTAIPITAGQTIQTTFVASLTGVQSGFHSLFVRMCDGNGKWSLPIVKPILVETLPATNPNISGAEYFIDTDPGYGAGTAIPITPGQTINTIFTVTLSGLSNGFHSLHTRTRDSAGKWSLPHVKSILVETISITLPNITGGEYYLDSDPGFGNGTPITVTQSQTIDVTFIANLTGLTAGMHNLTVRMRDANGQWSLPYLYQVNVQEPPGEPQFLLITYDAPNHRAILQWSPSTPTSGPIRWYHIHRSTNPYFVPSGDTYRIGTTTGTTYVHYDENVTQNQYYYRVTALDDQAR